MIRIVTDSSCDLPSGMLERHRIALVPLTIRFGDDVYADREEMDRIAFWDRMASGDDPEVLAPLPGRFRDTFIRLEAEGADGIVCLTASSALWGVHDAAVEAARDFRSGVPVAVVDSGHTSGALALTALAAAAAAHSMAPVDEIAAAARRAAASCGFVVAPDGTRHARRMRRLGPVRSLLSRWLVRNFLVAMTERGLAATGRVKNRAAAFRALVAEVEEADPASIAVVHADAPDIDLLLEQLPDASESERIILPMGPALGTLVGPGAVGVATLSSG